MARRLAFEAVQVAELHSSATGRGVDAGDMATTTPREAVEAVQAHPLLPAGDDERFTGYGVIGVPFTSGTTSGCATSSALPDHRRSAAGSA